MDSIVFACMINDKYSSKINKYICIFNQLWTSTKSIYNSYKLLFIIRIEHLSIEQCTKLHQAEAVRDTMSFQTKTKSEIYYSMFCIHS